MTKVRNDLRKFIRENLTPEQQGQLLAKLSGETSTNDTPDQTAALEEVLSRSMNALHTAVKQMEDDYQKDEKLKDLPYKYVIPEMNVNVKLTMSYTKSKGIIVSFFKRGGESQELVSSLELTAKAIPHDNKNANT